MDLILCLLETTCRFVKSSSTAGDLFPFKMFAQSLAVEDGPDSWPFRLFGVRLVLSSQGARAARASLGH